MCDEKRRFIGSFRRKDDAFLQQFPDHIGHANHDLTIERGLVKREDVARVYPKDAAGDGEGDVATTGVVHERRF